MNENDMSTRIPDLSESFPESVPDLKIHPDLNNSAHGPHHDVVQAIPGGTDQIRVDDKGDVLGGTTNIGKTEMPW